MSGLVHPDLPGVIVLGGTEGTVDLLIEAATTLVRCQFSPDSARTLADELRRHADAADAGWRAAATPRTPSAEDSASSAAAAPAMTP